MGANEWNTDAAAIFAQHFARTGFDDIPQNAVDAVKKSVLDTLGVSLAATTLGAGGRQLAELAKDGGGKEESTLWGFGGRVPACMAAWVNGGLAHSLDFDDIHYEGPTHPSGAIIPAAFAVAESVAPTSGKEFITAVALGHDMLMRMTSSMLDEVDLLGQWLSFPLFAVFAVAATASKLLKLEHEKTHMAIGASLAYATGAGEMKRGDLRGLYDSWAAMGGILAAHLARKGITGSAVPLEGEEGFFDAYYQKKYDRKVLLGDLGTKFYGGNFGYKAWPSCASTHPGINATLDLVREHAIAAEDVEQITVFAGPHAQINCEPVEYMRRPAAIMDAKFSVPYTVALAVIKKNVTLGDFTLDAIKNPEVLKMAQKVVPVISEDLRATRGLDPGIVQITTKSGKKHSKRIDFVYGHPRNPMSMQAVIDKFMASAAYSVKPFAPDTLEEVISLVQKLEEVNDVSRIVRLLG